MSEKKKIEGKNKKKITSLVDAYGQTIGKIHVI
jgi:hypothetical protein